MWCLDWMGKDYFCSRCKVGIKEKEYDWSLKHGGVALCRGCQKGKGKILDTDEHGRSQTKKKIVKKVEESGLSDKQSRYSENMIKGRIAETLVEELFLSLGYNVFRYGMENTVPGIMKLLKGVRGDVAKNIRRMPDFVVQKGKDVFFIEVKFRANGEFDKRDWCLKDYPYENAYFVVVSKKHIKCITYGELMDGKKVDSKSRNWLGSRKEFDLDKDVIIDFCKFGVKFFDGV